MPFHCAAPTRRTFLRQTLAGSLGLLTFRHLQAAPGVEANRWALLSDPHIAADPTVERTGINMAEHLHDVIAEVRALANKPEGLLLNGDCAYDLGLPTDYSEFLSLMKPVADAGIPMHFTLGNHDHRENFWTSLQDAAALPRPVAGKQVSIIEMPLANWFLLDSLDITKQTPGLLGEEQRAWLAKVIDARADKPALVMVHHNPIPPAGSQTAALTDAAEFLALLAPRRHVKAVFYGHTHVWRLTQQEGLHLINLPATGYPFNLKEATGWVDCRVRADGMSLELRAREGAHPDHGMPKDLAWRT